MLRITIIMALHLYIWSSLRSVVRMSVYGHAIVKCVLLISSDGRKSINMYITQKHQRGLMLVDHKTRWSNNISNHV